jgi:hypothetical protein
MSQDQTTAAEDSARINPTNEATFRALKTITSKCIQCEHHIEILENHLMKGTTPKGLTCTIQPNTPWTDSDSDSYPMGENYVGFSVKTSSSFI